MAREYAQPRPNGRVDISAWWAARNAQTADFQQVAANPEIVAMVQRKIRKSLGRTVDVPFQCDKHQTGYFGSLRITEGTVEIVYTHDEQTLGSAAGVALTGALASPLRITCKICGGTFSHNAVWVLRALLLAYSRDATTRPAVQIRT